MTDPSTPTDPAPVVVLDEQTAGAARPRVPELFSHASFRHSDEAGADSSFARVVAPPTFLAARPASGQARPC